MINYTYHIYDYVQIFFLTKTITKARFFFLSGRNGMSCEFVNKCYEFVNV